MLATAYAARMRAARRPEWLVLAFLRLVRAFKSLFGGGTHSASTAPYTASVSTAITVLAARITRYVGEQVPSAPPIHPAPVARELQRTIDLAMAKAHRDVTGDALTARIAVILPAETQLLTAKLTRQSAQHPDVQSITRETHSANPCADCDALAGTYTAPFPDDLFWSHPNCLCEWSEE